VERGPTYKNLLFSNGGGTLLSFQKLLLGATAITLSLAASARAQGVKPRVLTTPYQNANFQLTGITISKTGRFFVNFPRWSDRYQYAVIEVLADGSTKPFPDAHWNQWNRKPSTAGQQFVCVQSVVADDQNALWVVDPAAPLLTSPVPGGAKLVKIDLGTNTVTQVIHFGSDIVLPDSYLNDIRIDTARGVAYIPDSGHGGFVIVNLTDGTSRRVLDGHSSTLAEPGVQIVVNGQPVVGPDGQPPQFNVDGIALSTDKKYLYYKPVTAVTLYRVPTAVLLDTSATPAQVAAAVEKVAVTFPTDGLWMDEQDRLYLSDINGTAVKRLLPNGTIETVVADSRLQWPDTFTEGPDGSIYISSSEINLSPTYNNGYRVGQIPFTVYRIVPQ
jgi:sugar lactone lactonase YvrE